MCPSFGNGEFRRGGTYNTTIAYPSGILSTSICSEGNDFHQGFSAGNVTEQQHSTSYNSTCLGLYAIGDTTSGPYQSVPQDIIKLDPAWSSCTAVFSGAFDSSIALQKANRYFHFLPVIRPNIVLHRATALAPEPGRYSRPTPAPASPVAPPTAPATPTTPPNDPGKPETHSPAPKADPEGPKEQDPYIPDPVKSTANSPGPNVQGSDKQTPDQLDHEQPSAINNNDDSAASVAIPTPLDGANGAQGYPKVVSGPQSTDPQTNDEISQGDPEADSETGHNPGADLTPAGSLDLSPAENGKSLPSIGGHQIQAADEGGIVIASTTLQPGVQTIIDSTPISVGRDQIIVASSTIPLAPPSADAIITLINGDIISAGGKAAIVSGTTVALAPDGDADIVNGKTSPLPPLPTPILTVAGQTLTAAPTGFAIGSQSILPGGSAITYAGSVFSLATGGSALVVNGKTTPLPPSSIPVLTVAGQTLTPAPTGFAIGTQSLLPGGPAVTYAGSVFSLASGGNALIVNGRTTQLPPASISVFTVGSQTFTATPTGFAVGGQSVLPGGPAITYAGNVFSLSPNRNALIVNGRTTPLPPAPISVFTLGSQTFTAAPTGFAIGGESVLPGGSAVLVDGTLISLDSSSELIIGASTLPLGSAAQTDAGALGNLISYDFGAGASPTGRLSPAGGSSNGSNILPFVGGSGKSHAGVRTVLFALVVSLGAGAVAFGVLMTS